ncbi:3873_t:CDS:1, partial [Cetraspora pellucida]
SKYNSDNNESDNEKDNYQHLILASKDLQFDNIENNYFTLSQIKEF